MTGTSGFSASTSARFPGGLALAALLVFTFFTGGYSQERSWLDMTAQLLALPVLAWALWQWFSVSRPGLGKSAVAVAGAVFLLPLLQLLPLPEVVWSLPPARQQLARDLADAGVHVLPSRWTLSPAATELSLWSMLPALAAFMGALLLPPSAHRRLLWVVLALVVSSVLLAIVQLGLPRESFLNPYPVRAPSFNGVFANPNHQATALAVGLVLVVALLLERALWRRARGTQVLLAGMGLVMLVALPLTGSRGGWLVAMAGVALTVVLMRPWTRSHRPRMWRVLLPAAGLLVMAAIWIALGWMRVDIAEERRWLVATATFAMGVENFPLGIGMGGFVAWFDANLPASLQSNEFFNHAHNEYAQWWLEAGLLAPLLLVAVCAVLVLAVRRLLQQQADGLPSGPSIGAWCGVMVVLMHSVVDYPLRTPTLMTVTALLAGITVAWACTPPAQAASRSEL